MGVVSGVRHVGIERSNDNSLGVVKAELLSMSPSHPSFSDVPSIFTRIRHAFSHSRITGLQSLNLQPIIDKIHIPNVQGNAALRSSVTYLVQRDRPSPGLNRNIPDSG